MYGKKHSNETIKKMKANNAMNNPEFVNKVKASKQNIKWLVKEHKRKMAVANSAYWNALILEGYSPGYK